MIRIIMDIYYLQDLLIPIMLKKLKNLLIIYRNMLTRIRKNIYRIYMTEYINNKLIYSLDL